MEAVRVVLVVMVVEGVLVLEFVKVVLVVLVVLVMEGVLVVVYVFYLWLCWWWYLGRLLSFCWL